MDPANQTEVLAGVGVQLFLFVLYDYPLPSAIALGGVLILGIARWRRSMPHEPTSLAAKIGRWIVFLIVMTLLVTPMVLGFRAGNMWSPHHPLSVPKHPRAQGIAQQDPGNRLIHPDPIPHPGVNP
jgi:hypothetical protein